jgi:hypothetical protein
LVRAALWRPHDEVDAKAARIGMYAGVARKL